LSSFRARSVGATRSKGGRSQGKQDSFSEGSRSDCLCCFKRRSRQSGRETETPSGLELSSAAAERGNYPEAKPDGEVLKGRRGCKYRHYRMLLRTMLVRAPPRASQRLLFRAEARCRSR